MKKVTYHCDFCGKQINLTYPGPKDGVGVATRARNWHIVNIDEGDKNLCIPCLTNLQALEPKVCGGGITGCNGGPHCMSSHK